MKRVLFAVAVAGAMTAPNLAKAQTAGAPASDSARPSVRQATIESARKLIEVMHVDQTYDRVFKPMVGVLAAAVLPAMEKDGSVPEAVRTELATNEGKARVGRVVGDEFMAAFRARYSLLKEAMAKEYAAAFTEDELQAIIAFYSSGVGAKALALAPEIAAKVQVQARAIGEEAGKDAYRHILDRLDTRRGT
jgi:hypothetical protein